MPSDRLQGQNTPANIFFPLLTMQNIWLSKFIACNLSADLIVKMNVEMNCTSIIVTHQISTILRTADKIYMMYEGLKGFPENLVCHGIRVSCAFLDV